MTECSVVVALRQSQRATVHEPGTLWLPLLSFLVGSELSTHHRPLSWLFGAIALSLMHSVASEPSPRIFRSHGLPADRRMPADLLSYVPYNTLESHANPTL